MHELLIRYINDKLVTQLSSEETKIIKESFTVKKLKRKQFLLYAGSVCKLAGFICHGALKQYTIDDTGKENVLGLLVENWWAGDRESFMKEMPSPYYIDAVEDTTLLVITRESYLNKLQNKSFMNDLMLILTEKQAFTLLKRLHLANTLTAEQRLSELESTYPELFVRFPQHLIASYLGMTKETFSRLRGSMQVKNKQI